MAQRVLGMQRNFPQLDVHVQKAGMGEGAELLEAKGANPFRMRAIRIAADALPEMRDEPARILAQPTVTLLHKIRKYINATGYAWDNSSMR